MSDPVSQEINNLQNGVSQQSPALRFRSQCELQENCKNDPVDGMGKRPNSLFIGAIPDIDSAPMAVFHSNERDSSEKYRMFVVNGTLRVLDAVTGYEYPVAASITAEQYLRVRGDTPPSRSYQFLNTIDTTFILNKTVPVRRRKLTEPSSGPISSEPRTAVVSVARHPLADQADADLNYYITFVVNGSFYTYTDYKASSSTLAGQLALWIAEQYPNALSVKTLAHDIHVELASGDSINVEGYWEAQNAELERPAGTGRVVSTRYFRTTLGSAESRPPEALWYIKQTDYMTKYSVVLNDFECFIRTPETSSNRARAGLATLTVTLQMLEQINTSTATHGCVAEMVGNVLHIKSVDGSDFTIEAHDDLGDRASYAVKGWANSMDEVPPNGVEGFRLEIRGDVGDVDVEPYHIVWTLTDNDNDNTTGVWKETLKAGADEELDPQTMPHTLVRTQRQEAITPDNPLGIAFDLLTSEYATRTVGDDDTAPFPSFVSKQDENGFVTSRRHIKGMTYHKNRLCCVSDENLIFSETGNYQNFFPTTVVTTLDADPIDIALNVNSVSPVEHMVKHSGELFLFAANLQMVVRSGELFSADTLDVSVLSDYNIDTTAPPFVHEGVIHFWSKGDRYSQLYEYLPQGDTLRYKALPITPHVPRYVTGTVLKSVAVQSANTIFHLTRQESGLPVNYLYVTNVLMQGQERVQNAWQKWVFAGDVIDIAFIDNRLSLVINYEDGLSLESIILSHDPVKEELGIPVLLDRREEVARNYTLPDGDPRSLFSYAGRTWIGYRYNQKYVFSQFFPRDKEGKAITSGRLQLRYLSLSFNDTTTFKVTVDRGADSRVKTYEGVTIGSLQNLLGEIPSTSGSVRFPVHTKSTRAVITIENDSEQDALFHAAEWEGTYTRTTRRM